ncbi:YiaA/YiaB family inner membrane protein [Mycobacteroides salmoniphilum]|uniref:YiaA/YiaB family inner membrane protein n=1 Tax=Mycobacteroides salmoniphilum TaxID=404941 RepID=UPI0009919CF9|nr:YiaA/YiaB family inner membrane protein [Mycobacteroides salmoniphilum]
MSTSEPTVRASTAYYVQSAIAFAVAFASTLGGVVYLPISPWPRAFLAVCTLFLVTSCFGLAKVVRDTHESHQVRNRLDEARIEQIYAEHNPLKSAV